MEKEQACTDKKQTPKTPWNKGKLIGAKPPLRPSHVWSIRTKLQMQGKTRDLALFNLAIDSKLRGCDVVAVRVDDVAPSVYAMDRATIRQKKTGRPVRFELTDQTRLAIDEYLRLTGRKTSQVLFSGRSNGERGLTTVRTASAGVGCKHRARSGQVRNTLASPNEGGVDLPANRKSTCGTVFCLDIRRSKARCATSVSKLMTRSK